jgi:hypothetical protein
MLVIYQDSYEGCVSVSRTAFRSIGIPRSAILLEKLTVLQLVKKLNQWNSAGPSGRALYGMGFRSLAC